MAVFIGEDLLDKNFLEDGYFRRSPYLMDYLVLVGFIVAIVAVIFWVIK
jgi:uncharacterized membrane protein